MGFTWGLHGFTGFTRAGLQGVNIGHRVGLPEKFIGISQTYAKLSITKNIGI